MSRPSLAPHLVFLALALPAAPAAEPAERVLVLRGARIIPVEGPVIPEGTLVVRDGKIAALGPAGQLQPPEGAEVRDLRGTTMIPGLIDTHSHIGIYPRPSVEANSDGNEMTGPTQGIVRAVDAVWPDDPGIKMALAGGVTTANVMPGSGNVIGGQSAYLKLRGRSVEEMLIRIDPAPGAPPGTAPITGGLKMANGENPKRSYGGRGETPSTRLAVSAIQRAAFTKAREYREKIERAAKARAAGKEKDPPDRDLGLEPLVEALEGRRIVHFHTHRSDDILSALRLGREFGFTPVLHHVTEGYRVAEDIARAGAMASIIVLDSPGGKHEAAGFTMANGGILERAGVKVAIHTDDPITSSRHLLRSAALAVREGMSEPGALRALTLTAAEMLGLSARIGSLAVGKDADLVVLSGPPFSVYTQVLESYIEGERVFDRSRAADLRYQTGGFAVLGRYPVPLPSPPPPPFGPSPAAAAPSPPREPAAPLDESRGLLVLADWVLPVEREPIRDGAVVVESGRIAAVGPRAEVVVPPGLATYHARVVTPGLIDAHSLVGLSGLFNVPADQDQDETVEPNQAAMRALDSFNPAEPLLAYLLAQGVTVIQCGPGRETPIAGQAGIFRTLGTNAEAMAIRFPSAVVFNLGEEPKRVFGSRKKAPSTRMGTAAVIRAALQETATYQAKKARAAASPDKDPPDKDLRAEALSPLLERRIPALFTARREDDLETALRLASEFHLRAVLDCATEGYLIADRIVKAEAPVIAAPTMERLGPLETMNSTMENAALLARAGVRVAIQSGYEDYVPKTRVVRFEAAMSAANGFGFAGALRAITLDAARILEIDDRFGSLTPGKTADLVLFDGDPFEHLTHVERVVLNGRTAYAR
jgi:imidazolonepropionase-like amidohydrolase